MDDDGIVHGLPDTVALLLNHVTYNVGGHLALGAPIMLAKDVDYHYAWSPTGRWVAVRRAAYRGGDKIYLVNAADPARTVDVVLADHIQQQVMDPIWSPDGNTLIVFSVGYGTSQPYSLDIGAYLRSKGLQP